MQRGAKALGAKRAAHGIQQWRVWSMEKVRAKMNRQLQDSGMQDMRRRRGRWRIVWWNWRPLARGKVCSRSGGRMPH